jgi:two-component system cell cycle response regulator DivK
MCKVLVVEDTYLNRVLTKKLLDHAGFQVIEATNGKEGVEKALAELPDLILMDLSMPVMDGFCALSEIRSHAACTHIPVIAVTAHAMFGDEIRILNAGFNAYIPKPIDIFHFIHQIQQYALPI